MTKDETQKLQYVTSFMNAPEKNNLYCCIIGLACRFCVTHSCHKCEEEFVLLWNARNEKEGQIFN